MVAIVAGNGLGLFNASLNSLGGNGQGNLGQAGGQALVNVSNGNLVLRFTDEQLSGLGQDLLHTRTYNTQGGLSDGDADGWRWDGERSLLLTGTVNTAGSQVTRTTGDGHQTVYQWNGSRYQSTEGDGAHDAVTWDAGAGQMVWTDGSRRTVERYDDNGRLLSVTDVNGTQISYGYDADGRLNSVKDSSGQELVLNYNAYGKLERVDTRGAAGGALTQQVYYGYDAQGRLINVSTDLTPEDNSIADGNVYRTEYTYDGASFRIASVAQSDGTSASFTYQMLEGEYRIKTVSDSSGTTTFSYDTANNRTDVLNGLGQQWSYFYDANDRLIEVQTPAVNGQRASTRYAYDLDGNVVSVTDGRGNAVTYQYDANGNVLLERDATGATVARSYSADNQLLNEIRYTATATLNTTTGVWTEPSASTAQVTRLAYDSNNRVRFMVDGRGQVTEYRYDAQGLRAQEIAYGDALFVLTGLTPQDVLTESQLVTWAGSRDRTRSTLTELSYDYRGNLSRRVAYGSVSAAGTGIPESGTSVTEYVYSQYGQLLQTLVVREADRDRKVTLSSTVYDGLGRVVSQTDSAGTRTTAYDGTGRTVAVTNSAGMTITQTYNDRGQLLGLTQTAAGLALRSTSYVYDDAGRQIMVQDATGVRSYTFYDEAGRVSALVDGLGAVTEYSYNAAGQRVQEKRYATLVDTSAWYDGSGVLKTLVAEVRPLSIAADRVTVLSYDNAGRLGTSTDAIGTLTTFTYDGQGRLIQQQTGDRTTRFFYDASGHQIGQLDAEGYQRENRYDASGRLIQSIRYASVTVPANRASGTLDSLRQPSSGDLSSWYYYDTAGRQIGSVDEKQFVTETVYDEAGNTQKTIRYATAYTAAISAATTFATIKSGVAAGAAQTATTTFDDQGRVVLRVATDGTAAAYEYDSAGRLVRETQAQGTTEERSTRTRYDAFGQTIGKLLGEASARITTGMSDTEVAAIYAQYGLTYQYDAAGRVASATDALGNRTLSYYDAAGRLTHVVNAMGEVSETVYSAFGDVRERTDFTGRLATADTVGLSGGVLNAQLKTLVQAIRNAANDNRRVYDYDNRGLLTSTTDALGYVTGYGYNAFGNQTSVTRTIAAGNTVASSITYNKRGEQISRIDDVGGLARSSATVYDAFGRVISQTDGRGLVSTTTYASNGRVITLKNPLNQGQSSEYDAFGRVLKQTDALGKTTTYTYDDSARSLTVTTPDGVSVATLKNRHGQTLTITNGTGAVTRYSYNKEGQLVASQDALNRTTTNAYDEAGRLLTVTDALGRVTRYSYDAANRVLTRTDANNSVTRYSFDGQGRQVRVVDAEGKAEQRVTDYAYDRKGQQLTITQDPNGLEIVTSYAYDGVGQQVQIIRGTVSSPNQQITLYEFDKLGRRTTERQDPTGLNLTTRYSYNGNDQVTRKIDAAGNSTWYAYDNAGRVSSTIDALGYVSENRYDGNGRVIETVRYAKPIQVPTIGAGDGVTPALSIEQVQALLRPDSGDRHTQFVYDAVGRQRYVIDAQGAVTENQYDANGRLTQTVQYATRVQRPTYGSSDGATLSLKGNSGIFTALDKIAIDPAKTYTVRVKLRQVTGEGLVYAGVVTYDGAGNKLANASGGTFSYNAASAVKLTPEMGWQTFEGTISGTSPNSGGTNRNKFIEGSASAVPLLLYNYGVDGSGDPSRLVEVDSLELIDTATGQVLNVNANINAGQTNWSVAGVNGIHGASDALSVEQLQTLLRPESTVDRTTTYTYDDAGQQITVTDAAGKVESYTYDAVGNRKTLTNKNGHVWTYNYDALNRLVEEITPAVSVASITEAGVVTVATRYLVTSSTYDALGNVTSRTEGRLRASVVADPTLDELTEARTTAYAYDAVGRQIRTTSPGWFDKLSGRYQQTSDGTANTFQVSTEVTYDSLGNAVRNRVRVNNTGVAATDFVDSYKVYDVLGRVSYDVDALKGVTAYSYNGLGQTTRTVRYANALTQAVPATGYYLATDVTATTLIPDATQDRTLITSYDALGRKAAVQKNAVSLFSFTGDIATSTLANLAPTTLYSYDAFGQLVRETQVARNASGVTVQTGASTVYYYDMGGQRIGSVDALGYYTRMEYDTLGQLTRQTDYATRLASWNENALPTAPTVSDSDRRVRFSYDAMGRLSQTTVEGARFWQQSINATTRAVSATLVTADLLLSRSTYDGVGNVKSITDAQGNVVSTDYNALGQVVKVTEPARATAKNGAVDPFASADVIASPTTTLLLNAFGQQIREIRAAGTDSAGNVQAGLGQITLTRYDAAGHEIQEIDATGSAQNYKVDVAGRRIEESRLVSATLGAWTVNGVAVSYNQTLKRTFQYDALGQQTATVDWYTATNGAAQSTSDSVLFNRFGEVTRKLLNGNTVEVFNYDQAGRLESHGNATGFTAFQYDLSEKVSKSAALGDESTTADDRVNYMRNDLLGRTYEQHLPAFEANLNADTLNNVTLTLSTPIIRQTVDRWGNVLSRTDARGYVTTYTYDHNNKQLTETLPVTDILRENGTSYRANLIHEKHYDALGQLIQEVDLVGPYTGVVTNTVLRTRQHVYNQTGQLIRDIDALGYSRDYRVDANGNRVATRDALGVVTVDNYDAMDRHIDHGIIRSGAKVTLLTNLYDQAGRLYGEISGANAVEETLQSVANTSNWSSTTTGVVGNTKYSLFDERGNIVKTRNESKVEKSIEYDVNNRKVKETDGLNGTLTWTYDTENFGRLNSRKDLGGRVYSFTYNGFGQLIKETLTTASGAGPDKTYSYYANGLTKTIVEGSVTNDAAGTVTAEDSRTSAYAYDLNGNRIREINGGRYLSGAVSQVSSNEVRNKFDEQGRLKEVKAPVGNQLVGALGTQYTLVSTARLDLLKYDYDEMGNRRRVYMDTTSQSGGRTVKDDWYKYDLEGRAIVVEGFRNARGKVVAGALGSGNTTATAKAKGYALTYNAVGQRTSSERWKGFFLRSGHHEDDDLTAGELYEVEVYSYNDLGQLTFTVGRAAGREYKYGALTDTSQGSVSPRYLSDRFPAELLQQTKYSRSYDDRGNLISQKVYAYTMANTTTAGSTTRYTYRGDGQVISQFSYNSAQQLTQASYFGEADMLDAAGNQRGYRYVAYNSNGSINHRGNFSSEQILFDSYKESKATLTRTNGGSPGTTTYTYSARGELQQTVGTGGNVFTRGLATNAEGRLIERRESSGVAQTYLYYQGAALANIGNAAVPEISDTFTPISPDYPERTPSNYVVNQGDTLQSIAQSVWGDSNMWYLIADANGLDSSKPLNPGDNLKIPNVVSSTHNDADTFKPYSPDDVIGNTAPTPKAPPPPKPKKKKSGGLATVVMVVVAVVATVFTAGAATAVISGAASTLGGAAAAGTAALSAAAAGTAATISIGGAIIGAAVGSAASQLVGMGMGAVDKFSWGQVAASGITGGLTYGITSGIGTLAQGAQPGSWAQIAASAARTYTAQGVFNYAASQVANRIVGLDTSFSWNRLASSVVAANVSGQLNGRFGNQLSGQIVSGQVGAYASAAISDKWLGGSRPNHGQIAADAFGNTLGNFFVDQFRESSDEAVQRTMKLAGLPDDEVYRDSIDRALADGLTPEQLGDFYTHPGTRQVALHPTRPGENGGFMSYEGDGVWVGVPPLQEPITYSVGGLEGVLSLNGNSTLVDWANNFTPVVHERLVGFGNFAAEHEGATKLLSYAAQAFSYAVMGPFAVMRDIATEAVLGAVKSQVHDYAIEKVGDYYQSQGVRADNAVILANGTVFGVETVAGKVTSAVNGAKLYAMQMSGKATQNSEAVDLALKYKPGWTDEQRVEAAAKAKILNDAPTVVTASERSGTAGAMNRYRRTEQTPTGRDIDHMVDLQLGGSKTIDNLWPLDASVNRSLGSQVQHQIKNLPPGTVINRVTIGD